MTRALIGHTPLIVQFVAQLLDFPEDFGPSEQPDKPAGRAMAITSPPEAAAPVFRKERRAGSNERSTPTPEGEGFADMVSSPETVVDQVLALISAARRMAALMRW